MPPGRHADYGDAMRMGEQLGNYGPHLVVVAVITSAVVSNELHGSQIALTGYALLIAAGVWAWNGHHVHGRAVSSGYLAPGTAPTTHPAPAA